MDTSNKLSFDENTENVVTIINKDDDKVLSKPDSIHSLLYIKSNCFSFKTVSIKKWSLLETLVIENQSCSTTGSFEICDCPKLKSIKIGNESLRYASCFIFSI